MKLIFFLPRPKKHFKKSELRPDAPYFHLKKPDFDNLAKAVSDALTILGWWNDDSQICDISIQKLYASGRPSGAEIEILGL